MNTTHSNLNETFAELERERRKKPPVPRIGNFFGAVYVALTTIILGYGGLLGFASIVVMYAIWLPKISFKGQFQLKLSSDVIFSLALPAFAVLSTAWSVYRTTTIYNSLEYTSLVVCAIIVGHIVRTSAYVRGVIIGSALVLIASLASGHYGMDPLSGKYSLVGLFGSKNMVGLFAEIGILMCITSMLMKQKLYERCLFSIFPLGIFAVSLYLSKSASSVLSLILVLLVLAGAYIIACMPRKMRMIALVSCGVIAVTAFVLALSLGAQEMVLKSFGKDSTLTGRTHLWIVGINTAMQMPVIGRGYGAFWVQGEPTAEVLWNEFYVTGKHGFHFHNMYIETFVELGAVGVLLLAFMYLAVCFKSLKAITRGGMQPDHVLALVVSFLFLFRSTVEVDVLGTFSIGPLLFYSIIPRLATHKREQDALNGPEQPGTPLLRPITAAPAPPR